MSRIAENADYKNKQSLKKIYISLLCIVLIWRFYILISYCFHQTDIDQALMWYGTAEAGHFVFPEPHFYGQNYGSMVDSYLAVPLYWLQVPFNIALPIMVSLACLAAFSIMSIALFRKGCFFQSVLILLILGLNSWRWDINTSIPRSFFSGFLFAIIGLVLINESARKVPAAIGSFLIVISVSMTMTSLAIIGIGITGIFFNKKDLLLNKWEFLTLGGSIGLLYVGFVHFFYILYPEYAVFPALKTTFSIETFKENIQNIYWTLSNFSPFSSGRGTLCVFIIFNIFFVVKKRFKPVVLNILLVAGTLLLMFMQHTGGRLEYTLSSKIRIFLYIPYCLAMVVYTNPKEFSVSCKNAMHAVTAVFIVLLFCKTDFYLAELNNPDGELYHSTNVIQEDADSCLTAAGKIVRLADNLGVQTIGFRGNPGRVAAYATGALSYGRHEVHIVEVDRRYSMRESVNTWTPREVLVITYSPDNPEGWTYSVDFVEDIKTIVRSF